MVVSAPPVRVCPKLGHVGSNPTGDHFLSSLGGRFKLILLIFVNYLDFDIVLFSVQGLTWFVVDLGDNGFGPLYNLRFDLFVLYIIIIIIWDLSRVI